MKKLLTLSLAVLFVVVLSSLSFAQAPTLAPEGAVVIQQDEVVVAPAVAAPNCCCGPMLPGRYAPCRPFYRGFCASNCCEPCPCPAPCPAPCPTFCPRPVCAPAFDPCCDPCGYPAYGYRTPVRNFLGRFFAPRYYDFGCPPVGCGCN